MPLRRRRRRTDAGDALGRRAAAEVRSGTTTGFEEAAAAVERAKASLLSAVPGRRGPGAPLAVALAGFEEGLREATAAMPSWRETVVQSAWRACASALEEASRRAEHLRLEATPQGYEELYVALGELLDPLEAFRSAAEARRNMGRDR